MEKLSTATQVKSYLQISDDTYDTEIATFLPVAESAVLEITNNHWDIKCKATWTSGGTVLTIDSVTVFTRSRSGGGGSYYYGASAIDLDDWFFAGNVVSGTGIPDRSVISSLSDSAKTITIDGATTSGGDETEITINIFPTMAKVTLAKIVSYYYTVNGAAYSMDNESETVGTASFTRGDGESIGKGGLPEKFAMALRPVTRPRFA